MEAYKRRYEGLRWTILYGSDRGPERFALMELQRLAQYHQPYVIPAQAAAASDDLTTLEHVLLLGTVKNNRWLAELQKEGKFPAPTTPEGYTLAVLEAPWDKTKKVYAICGADANGVLYGVEEFAARIFRNSCVDECPELLRHHFDSNMVIDLREKNPILDTASGIVTEAPAVQDRGIWCWGFVIYDYRRFLDNMARLKMNMLTIWNDCPPLNAREIIEYAHSRGIRLIWGFHWGWGLKTGDLSSVAFRHEIRDHVVKNFKENYAPLNVDGIYFQTLTEHNELEINGRSVASLCCELVNDTAKTLYAEHPGLHIQFGLHATSIRERYPEFKALDDRLIITWEDLAGVPFNYILTEASVRNAESALAYAKEIAMFRPGTPFATVPKGWCHLRWGAEFEHHGPFILGERHPTYIRERLEERQPVLDRSNHYWYRHYPLATRFFREITAIKPPSILATGLVEDAMFEARIQPGVALLGEMLWNPHQPDTEILARAHRPWLNAN